MLIVIGCVIGILLILAFLEFGNLMDKLDP